MERKAAFIHNSWQRNLTAHDNYVWFGGCVSKRLTTQHSVSWCDRRRCRSLVRDTLCRLSIRIQISYGTVEIRKRTCKIWRIASSANTSVQSQILYVLYYISKGLTSTSLPRPFLEFFPHILKEVLEKDGPHMAIFVLQLCFDQQCKSQFHCKFLQCWIAINFHETYRYVCRGSNWYILGVFLRRGERGRLSASRRHGNDEGYL